MTLWSGSTASAETKPDDSFLATPAPGTTPTPGLKTYHTDNNGNVPKVLTGRGTTAQYVSTGVNFLASTANFWLGCNNQVNTTSTMP
jgi:hypothetical protein